MKTFKDLIKESQYADDYKLNAAGRKVHIKKIIDKESGETEKVEEKLDLAKATMGDVVKDFQKSDAPQFAGKSKEKRQQMAVAAKLQADREVKEATDTVVKDKEGKVISFKHEGDWKKANPKKNPEGKVHNLAGQALKQAKNLNKEEVITEGAYEKAEENKKSADAAKKQGDMFAHHLHMADHHDNLAQWHSEKGRHNVADSHARKSEEHHEKAMKLKEEAEQIDENSGPFSSSDYMPGKRIGGANLPSASKKDTHVKTFTANREKEANEFAKKHGYIVKKHTYPAGHTNLHPHEYQVHKEEVEQIDEKSEQARKNKTMKNMMDASRGARWKVQNKVSGDAVRDWDDKHKTAQAQNKAIGRALRNEEAEDLEEAVESGNKGYGYHGAHPSATADKEYSKAHATVKKVAGEAGHLRDAKKPNEMVKHYLDSRHGRHLADVGTHDHEYIKKDFGKFKKNYNPAMHEGVDFDQEGNLMAEKKTYTQFVEQLLEYTPGPGGVTKVKGRSYGAQYHDPEGDDDADDKPKAKPADAPKRGRGRPAGSKSGANHKVTTGKSSGGADYTGYKLHLPNTNR